MTTNERFGLEIIVFAQKQSLNVLDTSDMLDAVFHKLSKYTNASLFS